MKLKVEASTDVAPVLTWRWDEETDILSGAFEPRHRGEGVTTTIELTDAAGSIAVLDVIGGVLCGLDIVVWPEVETEPRLAPPRDLLDGRLHVQLPKRGTASPEIDAPMTLRASVDETVLHLRVGVRRAVSAVRLADRFFVEVDAQQTLAGFWLVGVPPFPDLPDDLV